MLSPEVETYDLKPEMSAEVTDKLVAAIESKLPPRLSATTNGAWSATGYFAAAVKAVETLDVIPVLAAAGDRRRC